MVRSAVASEMVVHQRVHSGGSSGELRWWWIVSLLCRLHAYPLGSAVAFVIVHLMPSIVGKVAGGARSLTSGLRI